MILLLPVTNQLIDKAANIYQSSFDGSHIQQLHIPIQQARPYPSSKIGHAQQEVSQLDKRIDNRKRLLRVFNKAHNNRSKTKKERFMEILCDK